MGKSYEGPVGCEQQVTAFRMPYTSIKNQQNEVTCKIGARQISARQICAPQNDVRQIVVAEVSSLEVDVGEINICTKHSRQNSTYQHEQN